MRCNIKRCCLLAVVVLVIVVANVSVKPYQMLMKASVIYRTVSDATISDTPIAVKVERKKDTTDTSRQANQGQRTSNTNEETSVTANQGHRTSNTNEETSGSANREHLTSNTNADTSGSANQGHRTSYTNADTSGSANQGHRTSNTNEETSGSANREHLTSNTKEDTFAKANLVHWRSNISYNGPFLKSTWNIQNKTPPAFLNGFKNPCWYERSYNITDAIQKCTRRYGTKNNICSIHSKNNARNHLLCMPYFFVIGLSKCGTTDLYNRIIDHPDVTPATRKEPFFWRRFHERERHQSITYIAYTRYFSVLSKFLQKAGGDGKSERITGEASPSTLWDVRWWWSYPENQDDEEPGLINAHFIRHLIPDVKLLVTLRNPTDRLYSEYLFIKRHEHPTAEIFHTLVVTEMKRFNECMTQHSIRHCVYKGIHLWHVRLVLGIYAVFLKDWLEVFPRDQFLILRLEDATLYRTETMSTVYKFLKLRDVSDEYGNANTHANERRESMKKVGEMKKETRVLLDRFYEPYNKELALLLNDQRWQY